MGRVRKASTRSSISSQRRDTWLFEMPVFVGETVHWTVSFSSSPHRLDEIIHQAGRYALHIGFLYNRCQGFLDCAAGLQE